MKTIKFNFYHSLLLGHNAYLTLSETPIVRLKIMDF